MPTSHQHDTLIGTLKKVRARVRGHSLDVLDTVQLPEGGVVTITLEELLSTPRRRPQRVSVWNDARLLGPFPLTRRAIYEDL